MNTSESPHPYSLVCFDLDGTLVDDTVYIWKTLHEGFHTDPKERQQAYDDYFSGAITYEEWFRHDLKLLQAAGANRNGIIQMCRTLKPMYGAMETLQTLKAAGLAVAVVSGSIQTVLDVLFPHFAFDDVLINRIHFNASGDIDGGIHTPFDVEAKADGLRHLCEKAGIATEQAVFVGDNENDIWIAKSAGLSIAFNCKSQTLANLCDVEIHKKDLRLVLPHILN